MQAHAFTEGIQSQWRQKHRWIKGKKKEALQGIQFMKFMLVKAQNLTSCNVNLFKEDLISLITNDRRSK